MSELSESERVIRNFQIALQNAVDCRGPLAPEAVAGMLARVFPDAVSVFMTKGTDNDRIEDHDRNRSRTSAPSGGTGMSFWLGEEGDRFDAIAEYQRERERIARDAADRRAASEAQARQAEEEPCGCGDLRCAECAPDSPHVTGAGIDPEYETCHYCGTEQAWGHFAGSPICYRCYNED